MRAEEVARADKSSMRASLSFLRKNAKVAKCVDGWDLVHVGLAMIRELDPNAWTRSFTKVNLHPGHRVPFVDWCSRIKGFLQGGESFMPEEAFNAYAMLPGWWHAFSPDEKEQALVIYRDHDQTYSAACVKMLHDKLHVPLDDMQSLRVCIEHAIEDPTHIQKGLPTGAPPPKEATEAQAVVPDANQGLVSFQLHPKKADGSQLFTPAQKFEHLIKMACRSVPDRKLLEVSAHLDVEISSEQKTIILNPTATDYMMHNIVSHTTGEGAKRKIAKRKLDSMGNATGSCGVLNDPARLLKMQNQLKLTESIAEINKLTQESKQQNFSLAANDMHQLAPPAIVKLKAAAGDAMQLTVKELEAIAFHSFAGAKLAGNKEAKAAGLIRLTVAQPGVLGPMQPALMATATATVAPPTQGLVMMATAVATPLPPTA